MSVSGENDRELEDVEKLKPSSKGAENNEKIAEEENESNLRIEIGEISEESERLKPRVNDGLSITLHTETDVVAEDEKVEKEFAGITPLTPLRPKTTFSSEIPDPIEDESSDNEEITEKRGWEIPEYFLIYSSYLCGMIVRDSFYYSLVSTGFNSLSLTSVFAFLAPICVLTICPTSCMCCCSRGYYCDFLLHLISWFALSFSVIPNIVSRLTFQTIFLITYGMKIMLILGSPSKHHSIRFLRFKHANIISFCYIAIFRWCFIGYYPIYVSKWVSGLVILFGVVCMMYIFAEESLSIISPRLWRELNEKFTNGTIHSTNDLFGKFLLPSKSFSSKLFDTVFKRKTTRVYPEGTDSLQIDTKKKNMGRRRGTKNGLCCIGVYLTEFGIGITQSVSFLLLSLGFGSVLTFLTHFVLPPLSLPVWAGRPSYWDGLFPILFLIFGCLFVFFGRNYIEKEDFLAAIEGNVFKRKKKKKKGNNNIMKKNGKKKNQPRIIRKGWKILNTKTLSNLIFSPCILINFFACVTIFFGFVSYAFNLNFVFWSGCILIMLIPSLFEFFITESAQQFQFFSICDVLDPLLYFCHFCGWVLYRNNDDSSGILRKYSIFRDCGDNRKKIVFKGPGCMFGCGYLTYIIFLFSSIGVFSYSYIPVFGDIFGGRYYLVIVFLLFLVIFPTIVSVTVNRCLMILRYRIMYARFEEFPPIFCCGLLLKSIFCPRFVETDMYRNIYHSKCVRRKKRAQRRKYGLNISESFGVSRRMSSGRIYSLTLNGLEVPFGDDDITLGHDLTQDLMTMNNNNSEELLSEFDISVSVDPKSSSLEMIKKDRYELETTQSEEEEESEEFSMETDDDDHNKKKMKKGGEEEFEILEIPNVEVITEEEEGGGYGSSSSSDTTEEEEEDEISYYDDDDEEEEEKSFFKNIVSKIRYRYRKHVLKRCMSLCEQFLMIVSTIPRFILFSQILVLLPPSFLIIFIGAVGTYESFNNIPSDDISSSYHSDFYRISTFNVFHGYMLNGMDNGPQIANDFLVGQKIDFCGFQETCTARPETGYQDIIKYYGIMSQSQHYYQGKQSEVSTIGVAMVSSKNTEMFNIVSRTFEPVEKPDGLNRMFMYASVVMNDSVVHVFNTHYDYVEEEYRVRQSTQILEFIEDELGIDIYNNNNYNDSSENPIIIMGDLNIEDMFEDESIQMLFDLGFKDAYFEIHGVKDYTYKKKDQDDSEGKSLDYILYRNCPSGGGGFVNLEILDAYVYRAEDNGLNRPSDHYPVVVDLRVIRK